jgi:hypothetical protein
MDVTAIAFDSNVLTFFLDANRRQHGVTAEDPLREQRIAGFLPFLFCRPFIVRTVTAEAERIKDDPKLREHMESIWYSFAECVPNDPQIITIERRASDLERFHPGEFSDCRILAEVEMCEVPLLVTFDTRFQRRLSPHTKVRIQTPVECWQSLAIPPGTSPQCRRP